MDALDGARGIAMLLVCLSHFALAYWIIPQPNESGVSEILTDVGMIASPTFMLISGFVIGYLTTVRANRESHYHWHLTDRGLVLLTIGHVWLGLTDSIRAGGVWAGLSRGFITDVIGLSLVVMVPLNRRMSATTRMVLGIAVAVLSYAVALTWQPAGVLGRVAHETFLGPEPDPVRGYAFPILPWFGVYLVASALGAWGAGLLQSGRLRLLGGRFLAFGTLAAALVLGTRLLIRHLRQTGITVDTWIEAFTTPWTKQPPGPGYLLFFGGLGAALIGILLLLPSRTAGSAPLRVVRLLGRNSLFVYLFQNLVYFVGILTIGWGAHGRFWGAALAGSLALVVAGTAVWERVKGNRWLTLGLRTWELARVLPPPAQSA